MVLGSSGVDENNHHNRQGYYNKKPKAIVWVLCRLFME